MKKLILIGFALLAGFLFFGFQPMPDQAKGGHVKTDEKKYADRNLKRATFAGGCFWCVESDFEKLDGVIEAVSGYTGGDVIDPTYHQVGSGRTGHAEAVQVLFDPKKISYKELLDCFWKHVDPTDSEGQFVDRGSQYRPAIFYHDEEQKLLAEESKRELEKSNPFHRPITTEIVKLGQFYPAEDYHQDYYKKNPGHYDSYRFGSGRDQFLKKIWGNGKDKETNKNTDPFDSSTYTKPGRQILKKNLTQLQYRVTQEDGTEPPFKNEYWDNKEEGIYVDVVSGEPLFSSKDKYDSGTGWPSFMKPLEPSNISEHQDSRMFAIRTEVRSKYADSHLGHVFPDGPPPTGLRYCMNSAALRFIPKEKLTEQGYGKYVTLFSENME